MKYVIMVGLPLAVLVCLIFYAFGMKEDVKGVFLVLFSGLYGILVSLFTAIWVLAWVPSPFALVPVGVYAVTALVGSRMLTVSQKW